VKREEARKFLTKPSRKNNNGAKTKMECMRGKEKEGAREMLLPTDRQLNPCFWGFPKEDLNAAQVLEG
jgi:hypothetical protein